MEKKKKIKYKLTDEEERSQERKEYQESIKAEVDKLNLSSISKRALAYKVVDLASQLKQLEELVQSLSSTQRRNVLDILSLNNGGDYKKLKRGISKTVIESVRGEIIKDANTEQAKIRARERYKKDIKQQEKKEVYQLWLDWKDNPSKYKNKTKFANSMISKFEPDDLDEADKHLSSPTQITRWCRDWDKGENIPD